MKRARDSSPSAPSPSSVPSVYAPAPHSLVPSSSVPLSASNAKSFVESFVVDLLPPSTGQANFNQKLRNRPILLEAPVKRTSGLALVHAANRMQRPKKLKPLTRKQKKSSGYYHIERSFCHWDNFLPLHSLWCSYMEDLVGNKQNKENQTKVAERLIKADYHGAIMRVKASRNTNLIGIEGIVIMETQETFRIIPRATDNQSETVCSSTSSSCLKIVPKARTIFEFSLPNGMTFELYGDHIRYRSSERAAKKFKCKASIEI
jgi:ribonuclease P protein subunit POP4